MLFFINLTCVVYTPSYQVLFTHPATHCAMKLPSTFTSFVYITMCLCFGSCIVSYSLVVCDHTPVSC